MVSASVLFTFCASNPLKIKTETKKKIFRRLISCRDGPVKRYGNKVAMKPFFQNGHMCISYI